MNWIGLQWVDELVFVVVDVIIRSHIGILCMCSTSIFSFLFFVQHHWDNDSSRFNGACLGATTKSISIINLKMDLQNSIELFLFHPNSFDFDATAAASLSSHFPCFFCCFFPLSRLSSTHFISTFWILFRSHIQMYIKQSARHAPKSAYEHIPIYFGKFCKCERMSTRTNECFYFLPIKNSADRQLIKIEISGFRRERENEKWREKERENGECESIHNHTRLSHFKWNIKWNDIFLLPYCFIDISATMGQTETVCVRFYVCEIAVSV